MNTALVLFVAIGLCLIILAVTALRFWLTALKLKYGRVDAAQAIHLQSNLVAKGPLQGAMTFNFPDDFYEKKLILLGEIHGYAAMASIDYEMMVHLNQRAGFRDYLAEHSPVEAALFNAYLSRGDEALLAPIFEDFRGHSRWSNTEFPDKLKKLKAHNDSLPTEARVSFTGVDIVQNYDVLRHWLGLKDAPEADGDAARATSYIPLIEAADPTRLIGGSVTQSEILHTLRLVAQGLDREAVIFESYRYQVTTGALKSRPAYGLWAMPHVLRASINKGFLPFAARVAASDLPAANAMASIAAWSDRGSVMIANTEFKGLFRSKTRSGVATRYLENDGPIYFLEGLGDLKAAAEAHGISKAGMAAFKLGGESSPFLTATGFGQQHTTYRFGLTYDATDTPVTEVFDYAMLVHGSAAATPAITVGKREQE